MLSFMKEQGVSETLEENQNNEQQDGQQEYLSVSKKKQNVKKGTMILTALFVIGFICLFLMIKQTTPKSAEASQAEDAQLEIALAKLTGSATENDKDMNKLVNKFYEAANVKQIKANELKKNPFQLEMFNAEVEAAISDKSNGSEPVMQPMMGQNGKLKLFSVMQSPEGSCCMINDELLYVGDKINGMKIVEINKKSVKLSNGEREIYLTMDK